MSTLLAEISKWLNLFSSMCLLKCRLPRRKCNPSRRQLISIALCPALSLEHLNLVGYMWHLSLTMTVLAHVICVYYTNNRKALSHLLQRCWVQGNCFGIFMYQTSWHLCGDHHFWLYSDTCFWIIKFKNRLVGYPRQDKLHHQIFFYMTWFGQIGSWLKDPLQILGHCYTCSQWLLLSSVLLTKY